LTKCPRLLSLLLLAAALLPAQTAYQKPPGEILSVLDAPPTPVLSLSPARTHLLLLQGVRYPPIEELAQPMLRLAGLRLNPNTNGPHRPTYFVSLTLRALQTGAEIHLRLPAGARLSAPRWSPDGARLAFLNTTSSGIELWIGETAMGGVRKLPGLLVNAAIGEPFQWMPDSRTLLVQLVPPGRGRPPTSPQLPVGPIVQESSGKAGPLRTYQDLLASPHDEALFDYYATSHLALVDASAGKPHWLGKPAIFQSIDPSPDGRHILTVHLSRPYSYLHTHSRFPREVEIWDRTGALVHKLASLSLAERVPIDGVPTGPRSYRWQPTQPATLVWVEALDGGDPRKKVPHRDRILSLAAPYQDSPVEVFRTEHRFSSIDWGENGDLLLIRDNDRDRRWTRTFLLDPRRPSEQPRILWSRSSQDRYGDPGSPTHRTLPSGHRAMLQSGDFIYLSGDGASPKGDRPFLDRFNWKSQQSERLFHCEETAYESYTALLDPGGARILTRRETPAEPPNYYIRDLRSGDLTPLTRFPDPAPQLRAITKQRVTYKRADGVALSFTLYLPPGYKAGTRLPTVLWAYPREYNDPETAAQIVGSTQRFTSLSGASHLFLLLAGYAVLDGASMPVIGDPETVNNTYIEQIVASAKAAIDKAVELGVTDPDRIGVGGHSYGAFMTANLLAHSDLFRAGIARSGAYNRTLTPFGFQNERRTLWQAPGTYLRMSPFLNADKINEPVLLIHGEADNNSGTFPIQSDRMYQAVRGNGGVVRFVLLPFESHSYAARESVAHVLAEMIAFFDKHVKPARPLAAGKEPSS